MKAKFQKRQTPECINSVWHALYVFTFLNELLLTSGASFWWQCKHKQTTGSV